MGNETRKAQARRSEDSLYDFLKVGRGIDIGCGDDPVNDRCLMWDVGMGDAQKLEGVPANYFDWVYSSHCLEHVSEPRSALLRWWETVIPGGHLFIIVPDEDLYEQGVWPSRYNGGHTHSFTIKKEQSWSPVSINVQDLAESLPKAEILRVKLFDTGYDYSGGEWDRTGSAEVNIELIARKKG